MKRHILALSILAGAILLNLQACKKNIPEEKVTAFSMSDTMYKQCAFQEAQDLPVKNEIRLFGKITADNNKTAQVYSVLSGVVKSIDVGLGDYVRQGQVLATIQSTEVATFQQEKLDAINDKIVAEKNLQVQMDLHAGKLNSDKDLAAAKMEVEKAQARLDKINEVFNIYGINKGAIFKIVAPINGFVLSKNININELLRTDEQEPLFSIAEMNEIWAIAFVNETDIPNVKEGSDVLVNTVAFPDLNYQGKIEKIYNLIDPATKAMKVRVRIPNPDLKLKPDMNCTVSVQYLEDKKLTALPSSAIIFDKSKNWAMVYKDRHNIETRLVEVYRQLGGVTYIKSGVKAGENVITKNALLVYDAIND